MIINNNYFSVLFAHVVKGLYICSVEINKLKINIMTFTTTQLNGKTEQVIIVSISQKEGLYYGLEKVKGKKPFCVTFGSDEIYQGFGYDVETAINNAKIRN